MLLELLTLGSFWFWLVFIGLIVILFIEVINEAWGASFMTFLGSVLFIALFTSFKFSWLQEHKPELLFGVGAYFVLGVVVALIKWHFLARDARDEYDQMKVDFFQYNDLPQNPKAVVPVEMREKWVKYVSDKKNIYCSAEKTATIIDRLIPKARDNKEKIVGWMAYWPFVAIYSLFHDIVRRIWESIYRWFASFFQSIANFAFRGVSEDLTFAPKSTVTPQKE